MAMTTKQGTFIKTPAHIWLAPPPPIPSPRVLLLSSILDDINSSYVLRYCYSSSHAPGPIIFHVMASLRLHSHSATSWNNGLILACSILSPERTLLNVISGVDDGFLQDIPWESLPFCRLFVKERFTLVAFFSCHCSSQDSGPLWCLNSGLGLSFPVGEVFAVDNSLILSCKSFGWKEGAIGTLSCKCKADRDSLL